MNDHTPTFADLYSTLIETYDEIISLADTMIGKTQGTDLWYWNTKRADAVQLQRKAKETLEIHTLHATP
jgi:hypothetical protein